VTYSGDENNASVSSGCSEQTVSIDSASPGLTTSSSPGGAVGSVALNDSATLSGGYNPSGSLTFDLYDPSSPNCSGPPAYTQTVGVSDGNSTYSTSSDDLAESAGTWNWTVNYSGDENNASASSGCASETIIVGQGAQTITFTSEPPTDAVVGGSPYLPTAMGGASDNPVNISIDSTSSGVCSISDGLIRFGGVGTCTLIANEEGNDDYQAAPEAQQSFNVVAMAITTETLPAAVPRSRYVAELAATGGTRPYTWTISTGRLPIGLHLSKLGIIAGILRGSDSGTYRFEVELLDKKAKATKGRPGSRLTATASLSITVG
jgi:Putative Ig domain